jgi:hypothetical protein
MRQLDLPNGPAKQTRQNVLPWEHAKSTRECDPPNSRAKDPPFPAQDPQAGHNLPASPPPPPTAPSAEQGEGVGSRPGPPTHLVQVLLLSLTCLHILTGHNIYAFYIERINKYKMYCFRRRKNCKEGVRSWSPPGPVKGSVLHNLEYYRRPAGLPY